MAKTEVIDLEVENARARMQAKREAGYVRYAAFDRAERRVILELSNGTQFRFEPEHAEGLERATEEELEAIEVSPSGLGLYWPRLDVGLDVPSLLQGIFGTRKWMAANLGQLGGQVTSAAKSAAARENGKRGGRPAKATA